MKISVIIPIYKVEPYLCRCLDSILSQTYPHLEVILVDDGSPDGCPAICDKYAEKDPRITVIHKANGGLSDARNAGLKIASGEWISFIDSDDWIEPDMYEKLLENAKKYNAQISVGGVNDELMSDQGTTVLKTTFHGEEIVECLSSSEAMKRHLRGSWAAWDKIYHREVFNGISFPVGEINEDEPIMLHLLDRSPQVAYTNRVFYHYIHRPSSITTSSFSAKKLAWPKHCEQNLDWIRQNHPELEADALSRYCGSLLWALREIALSPSDLSDYVPKLRKEVKENYPRFSKSGLNRQTRVRLFLNTYLPYRCYRLLERLLAARSK